MASTQLMSLGRNVPQTAPQITGKILLAKLPFFTPWTPPLGIALLKSFLQQGNHEVRCVDFNVDTILWGTQKMYFDVLTSSERLSANGGHSQLWSILNAHMLAFMNDPRAATCSRVLEAVIPMYGIKYNDRLIRALLPIVERFYERLGEVIDEVDLTDVAVVGTSTYTTSLSTSLFFLERVKRRHPQMMCVMGGGVFADDLALGSDNLDTLVKEYPFVDHVVLGEGELLFLKLLRGELPHKRVITIADLGRTTLDMKDVPLPDFTDFEMGNYFHLTIEGARSCPFQCGFCSETVQWGDYRKKSKEVLPDQVIKLAELYNKRTFFMGDSLMDPYISGFSSELLRRNANIRYDGYLRADKISTDRERTKKWASSGLHRVRLGIESASSHVLDMMAKMTRPETIAEVLKSLANAGIRTSTYWIAGFPGETEQDFEETLEFVRENHRFIYELEAHPFWYYPYGQIASRQYESISLYPDEVTQVIKFRQWEVSGAYPNREERFDRLRRISLLADELGIPNIYTMTERVQAEQRWQMLHPGTVEVYDGTHQTRSPAAPLKIAPRASGDAAPGSPVLSYRVSLARALDREILREAMEKLVEYNEVLQADHGSGAGSLRPRILCVDAPVPSDEDELRRELSKMAEALAKDLRPAGPEAVAAAILGQEGRAGELLFLVHREAVDGRSIILLLEDLFRLYEQVARKMPISLRPVDKPYSAILESQWRPVRPPPALEHAPDHLQVRAARIGGPLHRRLISGTAEASDAMLVAALLRALSSIGVGGEVDILLDGRRLDPRTKYTAGPLTSMVRLSALNVERDPVALVQDVEQAILSALGRSAEGPASPVLIDLDRFVAPPWMGGDSWRPRGFLLPPDLSPQGRSVFVSAAISGDDLEILVAHDPRKIDSARAEQLLERLSDELKNTVDRSERYSAARLFWPRELGQHLQSQLLALHYRPGSSDEQGIESMPLSIDVEHAQSISLACGVGVADLLLAVYSIVLSRLSGREDLFVLAALPGAACLLPIYLHPASSIMFKELARHAALRTASAEEHSLYAEPIVREELKQLGVADPTRAFDAAFLVESGEAAAARVDEAFATHDSIALALQVRSDASGIGARLYCKVGRLGVSFHRDVAAQMHAILEQMLDPATTRVGKISVRSSGAAAKAHDGLRRDEFRFA